MTNCPHDLPEPVLQDWYVSTKLGTGLVTTDQDGTIINTIPFWRRFIGMHFDVFKQKVSPLLVQPLVGSPNSLDIKQ